MNADWNVVSDFQDQSDFKILLCYPPKFEANNFLKHVLEPKLVGYSLAIIAGVLKQENFSVRIYEFFDYTDKQITEVIRKEKPTIVGINTLTEPRSSSLRVAKIAKAVDPAIKVVLGGPHVTHLKEILLEQHNFVDYLIVGEGEITFRELCLRIRSGNDSLGDIDGLIFRSNEKIIVNKPRQLIKNLDSLPLPAYDCYANMHVYRFSKDEKLRFMIVSSRGCPGRCTFCDAPVLWNRVWRFRSATSILEEIKYLQENYHITHLSFEDDAFTSSKKRVHEVCEGMINGGFNIKWTCVTRADFLDENTLDIMKKAGCTDIHLGLESASPTILKSINKSITPEQVEKVTHLIHKKGIRTMYFLIIGNIGETKETIMETIQFINRVKPTQIGCSILMIYPETDVFKFLKQKNLIDERYWKTNFPAPFCDYNMNFWVLNKYVDKINRYNNYLYFNPIISFLRRNMERFLGIRISFAKRHMKIYFGVKPITVRNWKYHSRQKNL